MQLVLSKMHTFFVPPYLPDCILEVKNISDDGLKIKIRRKPNCCIGGITYCAGTLGDDDSDSNSSGCDTGFISSHDSDLFEVINRSNDGLKIKIRRK